MKNRLRDRYDVSHIRFTRQEPGSERNRALMRVVDGILPGGSVFHLFGDTPDQFEDMFAILIDDAKMVYFELERDSPYPAVGDGSPFNVRVEPVEEARSKWGQEGRKSLDSACADARRLLA